MDRRTPPFMLNSGESFNKFTESSEILLGCQRAGGLDSGIAIDNNIKDLLLAMNSELNLSHPGI